MEENKYCPCCGRHCDLSTPHCDRGREYLRTGVIPERGHREEGEGKRDRERNGRDGRDRRDREAGHRNVRHTTDYSTMDMDNKLIVNLRDLGHRMRFLFEGKGSQKRILIILRENGSMTQRELTERIGVQPGSVSEVLGKLENAGLIQRKMSQADRRTTDIELTEAGQIQAKEASDRRKERHQEMFSCLSEEEKNVLLNLTEKLNADWDSRYGENRKPHGEGHHGERHSREF